MQWLKALIISLAAAAALPAAAAPPQALAVPALFAELDRRAGANNKVFVSPISIEQAFGLLHAGAAGETRAQIEAVFGWPAGEAATRRLEQQRVALLRIDPGTDLRLANALWLNRDFRFSPSFLATTRDRFDATAESLDFAGDSEGSARRINSWATDKTNGLISDIVTPEQLAMTTTALLSNALYFEADWQQSFFGGDSEPFLFGDGHEAPFHLMNLTGQLATAQHRGWRAVRLPFGDGRFAMDVAMPREREVPDAAPAASVLAALDRELADGNARLVALKLPRFEIDYSTLLKSPLADVGLTLPFDPARADLSDTAAPGQLPLFVGEATHITKLQVFEKGIKAAAVTVVTIMVSGGQRRTERPTPFVVDRPFVAVLRDLETGEVLFVGRIADPQPFTPTVERAEEALGD